MSNERASIYRNQNFNKLKDECLKSEKLYNDDLFNPKIQDAIWLRPPEICKEARFIVEGVSRFDAVQGQLGDCWLIVAMSNLAMNKVLFGHVVPADQSFVDNYAGIFRFRIWQCGDWVEVVIDDKLPTKEGELMYAHSKQSNEFWCPLLEKAYAKVYGSYEQLVGGWFCESMVDLTGGMVETVRLDPPPPILDKILLSSMNKGSFMCASMKKDPSTTEKRTEHGLVMGHAYSITKVQYVTITPRGIFNFDSPQKILLIRLRNPWGQIEWDGPWSDSSPEWKTITDEEKENMGLTFEEDGEFFMSFDDFKKNFLFIDICHLSPLLLRGTTSDRDSKMLQEVKTSLMTENLKGSSHESVFAIEPRTKSDTNKIKLDYVVEDGKIWEEHAFKGEWIKDVNAGGISSDTIHTNPQFRITLLESDDDEDDTCTLIVALMQKNKSRKVWHRIGFTAFQIDNPDSMPGALSKEYLTEHMSRSFASAFKHRREIVVRLNWRPGTHCLLPSTYRTNEEGQFLLRVFSEKKSHVEDTELSNEAFLFPSQAVNFSVSPDPKGIPAAEEPTTQSLVATPCQKLVYRSDQEVLAFFNRAAGQDKEVGWQGLQSVLQFAMSPNLGLFTSSSTSRDVRFPKYECRCLIAMLDDDRSGRLGWGEFQHLWGRIRLWESSFLRSSEDGEHVSAAGLRQALVQAGYKVPSRTLGSLVARHADDRGKFTFNDFVMCAVELQTT